MHFFRLRIINTVLFLVIGILIGFILKGRFYAPAQPASEQRYHPAYENAAQEPAAADTGAEDNQAADQPADSPAHTAAPARTLSRADETNDNELRERSDTAVIAGMKRERMVIDPGFGFGKNREENHPLLRPKPPH